MTRRGLENQRVRVFLEMTRHGATTEEALAYIDLVMPLKPLVEPSSQEVRQRQSH